MNDLISRSALLENYGLKNAVKYGNETAEQQHNSYSTLMLYEVADMINEAPAVDAEPVEYSMWLEHAGSQHTRYWTCLKCDTLGSPRWKRCPVCEAKMDGGAKDAAD